MFSPQLYLMAALACALPVGYGVMWARMQIAKNAAYEAGKAAGANAVAVATNAASNATVAAVAEGEASAAPVSADKAKIIELCNRSASCRDRPK